MTGATNGIETRAILVRLSLSMWSARRYDRELSEEANRLRNAEKHASRSNKYLLAGADARFKRLVSAGGKWRTTFYEQTLPWADTGWRLLPLENFLGFADRMRECRAEWDEALASFEQNYEADAQRARDLSPGMFTADEYPPLAHVRTLFRAMLERSTVPSSDDIRVIGMSEEQRAALESEMADRSGQAVAEAMRDAWRRLYEVVAHMQERLSDPENVFRDSLVGNIQALLPILARLNVAADPELSSIAERVSSSLAQYEPDELRKDAGKRASAADEAAAIMSAMSAFYSPSA